MTDTQRTRANQTLARRQGRAGVRFVMCGSSGQNSTITSHPGFLNAPTWGID